MEEEILSLEQKKRIEKCYKHGLEMYAAAKTLYTNPRQTIQEDAVVTVHAECMLMAFACELFIKTMLYYENSEKKKIEGHSLKELFDKLSSQTKDTVIDVFNKAWDCDEDKMYRYLKEITYYFVDLRYMFEKKCKSYILHTDFLFCFGDVLRWRCKAGKSVWGGCS